MSKFQVIAKLIGIRELRFDEIELRFRSTINPEDDIIIRVPENNRYYYGSYYVINDYYEIIGEVIYF